MLLRKEFSFDAAHNLVEYHGKCERLHGHTYKIAVTLKGTPDREGMILDFCELSSLVKEKVIEKNSESIKNTTSKTSATVKENIKNVAKQMSEKNKLNTKRTLFIGTS